MNNVKHAIRGHKLMIEVDLSPNSMKAARPSASGRTMIVATSGAFQPATVIAGKAVKYSVNVTVET